MLSLIPKELSFIDSFRIGKNSIENASWLLSQFSDESWICEFGKSRKLVNFRVLIDDGSLLTHPKNRQLLVSIKKFLCLQTHPLTTGAIVLASITALQRVSVALHVVDYFLLRSAQFEISKHGFQLITANEIISLVDKITKDRNLKTQIYDPKKLILHHLGKVQVAQCDMESMRFDYPDLFEIDPSDELALCPEQTLVARVWLMKNGYYVQSSSGIEYRRRVSRTRLLDQFVGPRVLTKLRFLELSLPGLDITPSRWYAQELTAVPVSNLEEDKRPSASYVALYLGALRSMGIARKHGVNLISDSALAGLNAGDLLVKERGKESTRFTTLPFKVANQLLSGAVAFYLEYGEQIVDYYLALAQDGRDPRTLAVPVPTKLQKLGILKWRSMADTPDEFFYQLRHGENLHNMIEVLWGAIAVIVNSLMARRVSELKDLTADSIVEKQGMFFLAFDQRKENVVEQRKRSLRPMPALAAEALTLLSQFSQKLTHLGYQNKGKLFEMPLSAWSGSLPYYGTCQPDFARCFNRFCDYIETGLDEFGRRYYVRTHQLRRNFAMLFFWKGSHGGVEVLRYFLGHSKPAQTYRYVTEAVSGKVLRRVKATIAKDLIKVDHTATAALAKLICDRYSLNLNDLHILPDRDVVYYVEDLMASGEADIEPEFFHGPNGEDYRILYKIKKIKAT